MASPVDAPPEAVQEGAAEHDARDEAYALQMQRILGGDVMAVFAHPDTSEVYTNPDGRVWAVRHGRGHVQTGLSLRSAQVDAFLSVAATRLRETLTPRSAHLGGELPQAGFGGARLQGVIPPVSTAPLFRIRKRPTRVVPLQDYVTEGVATKAQYDAIRRGIAQDAGIVIAGPTASGKTFLLNSMLREQVLTMGSVNDPVFVLEDTAEVLSLAPNTVSLRTTPEADFDTLLYVSLRLTPRYLHVGECRRHAAQMLEMWATGHPGMCTLHADSAEGALERLRRLARRDTGRDEGWLVSHAVGMVVVIRPTPTGRRVTDVARCTGYRRGRFELARP